MDEIISLGADKNNSFSVISDKGMFISDPFKDLNMVEDLRSFENAARDYLASNNILPKKIVCDMHPDYRTTCLASELGRENPGVKIVKVQHHFAHIAACMSDNDIEGEVLGVSFDGAGYGTDGNIWGGEFLICDRSSFQRAYHIEYIPQPGGDVAARQGWRMALAYINMAYGDEGRTPDIDLMKRLDKAQVTSVLHMLKKGLNSPLTSSAGRLFDAVASLTGVCDVSAFEAEGAMRLENLADNSVTDIYGYDIDEDIISFKRTIRQIVEDLTRGVGEDVISAKFHNMLGEVIYDISERICDEVNINRVVISGGCFQNKYLVGYLENRFKDSGLELYKHKKYSPADSNISVGQAAVAAAM